MDCLGGIADVNRTQALSLRRSAGGHILELRGRETPPQKSETHRLYSIGERSGL